MDLPSKRLLQKQTDLQEHQKENKATILKIRKKKYLMD